MIDRRRRRPVPVRMASNNNERLAASDGPNIRRANRQPNRANDPTLLVIAVELRRRVSQRKFLFSETARPKGFPSSPSFPTRPFWHYLVRPGRLRDTLRAGRTSAMAVLRETRETFQPLERVD